MKEYKLTSADFVAPGEALVPDAILSPEDMQVVKSQSGLAGFLLAQIEQRKQHIIEPFDMTIGKSNE